MSRLKERRKELGLTQKQMAERTGIGQSKLSAIERGYRDDIKTGDAFAVSRGYEIGVLEVLELWGHGAEAADA